MISLALVGLAAATTPADAKTAGANGRIAFARFDPALQDTVTYTANIDGSNLRRISNVRAIEVEPKVNPKNANQLAFVSGRTGKQQVYMMNSDGTDVQMLSNGEGELYIW